jgi:hypothetical protein
MDIEEKVGHEAVKFFFCFLGALVLILAVVLVLYVIGCAAIDLYVQYQAVFVGL